MRKIKDRLDKQLKMPEYADDAKDCLIIFNYLKEVDEGHIWESRWNPLVSTRYIGNFPNTITIYRPTDLGRKVIDSLKSNKAYEVNRISKQTLLDLYKQIENIGNQFTTWEIPMDSEIKKAMEE